MNLRGWVGMTFILQAVGVASLHSIFRTSWLIGSIVLGGVGIVLLMVRRRSNRCDPTIGSDGDFNPQHDSEYSGSQSTDLLGLLGDYDEH
jgi:hypothetical protein